MPAGRLDAALESARLAGRRFVEEQAELLRKEFAEPSAARSNDREAGPISPSPAGSAASEDEGQRLLEDMSASEMSDKNPAGLHPLSLPRRHSRTSNETTRERRRVSLDAWARGVVLDALDARRDEVSRMHLAALASPQPELATAVEQLRRVGRNLNQALRAVNGGCLSGLDDGLLRQVQVSVDDVRASLGDRTAS
jgi:hypothetical protein